MRMAIFVAVVAAHLALVWYFLTLWHLRVPLDEDQPSMTMVFLPPPELTGVTEESTRERAAQHTRELAEQRRAGASLSAPRKSAQPPPDQTSSHRATAPEQQPTPLLPGVPQEAPASAAPTFIVSMPDWHQQAEIVAQSEAPSIVEAEDKAKRQAGALTAMIEPMPGSRVRGPSFHWDPNPRYRWQPAQGGGFVIPLNDHCEVFVLVMIWVGCSVGKLPPAHGDLFLNMHPPVKYGDWDWRLDDP